MFILPIMFVRYNPAQRKVHGTYEPLSRNDTCCFSMMLMGGNMDHWPEILKQLMRHTFLHTHPNNNSTLPKHKFSILYK